MRIIGGKYRGKKLIVPDGYDVVRPTSDRVREALFSILYSKLGGLADCDVLDVFAGTGAFGLEALSRGANSVAFADKDVKLLQKNIALFPAEKNKITCVIGDVLQIRPAVKAYNLVFSDAPYDKNLSSRALQVLAAKGWLAPSALCLVETRKDESLQLSDDFVLLDERCYGIAKIRFYTYK